jgi:hypothetical protein
LWNVLSIVSPVTSSATDFNFRLQLLTVWLFFCANDIWGRAKGNYHRDSSPVNMVARTTHTGRALEIDSTEHSYRTLSIGRSRQNLLYVDADQQRETILCAYGLLLELLQRPEWLHCAVAAGVVSCYAALHKDSRLLTDCTTHGCLCRKKLSLHDETLRILRGPEIRVVLVHGPKEGKTSSVIKKHVAQVAGYCFKNCTKSRQKSHHSSLAAVSICLSQVFLVHKVKSGRIIVRVDVTLILSDWKHRATDCLAPKHLFAYTSSTVLGTCWPVPSHPNLLLVADTATSQFKLLHETSDCRYCWHVFYVAFPPNCLLTIQNYWLSKMFC